MNRKKGILKIILAMVIGSVILFAALMAFDRTITNELEEQVQTSLAESTQQNRVILENEVRDKQNLLRSIATEMQECWDEKEEFVSRLSCYIDVYGFKRIGFVSADGTVITTDGYTQDLSYRDFFQKSIQGEEVITDVMTDSIGRERENINVFSVPVYAENSEEIAGVLFATYRTEKLREMFQVESFGGVGSVFIIRENGDLVTSSVETDAETLEELLNISPEHEEDVSRILKDMEQHVSGEVILASGMQHYCCYMPVSFSNSGEEWYLFYLVSADVLTERTEIVLADVRILIFILYVIVIVAALSYAYYYHQREKRLFQDAYCDPLTGGANLAFFQRRVRENRKRGCILAMDLEDFRFINSTYGSKKGNELLNGIWDILCQETEKNELAAHVSADNFVLWLDEEEREKLAERVGRLWQKIRALSEPMGVLHILPKFGLYLLDNPEDVEAGYELANFAKKYVKGNHNKSYAFFDNINAEEVIENVHMEDEFESALTGRCFQVWYQPKYDPNSGVAVGAEALVRWKKDDGKQYMPSKFIPLFERNGLIVRLDEYMFQRVCEQQKKWLDEGKRVVPVSVNVSRATLCSPNIAEKYKKILDSCGLEAEYVQIEVTESAIAEDDMVLGLIRQFCEYGFKILIDDFGRGSSNLSVLKIQYIDNLKIDKSLIDGIGEKQGDILLSQTLQMAFALGLTVTAEGVETREQLAFLQEHGCSLVQGYYFSRPLPEEEYEKNILDFSAKSMINSSPEIK